MLFNSLVFILFFTVVTILYWSCRHQWRWLFLLVSSCYFYMYLFPKYILILFLLILIDYFAGIFIENTEGSRRKLFLILSLFSNVFILFYFKYTNFIVENANYLGFDFTLKHIILPIGLSFHTFQSMSYTIEVYRKKQRAERHLGVYALYVLLYPQLVAGPIERPQNMLPQIHRKAVFNYQNFTDGLKLMAFGFFKKAVIADRLSLTVDAVFNNYLSAGTIELWLATLFFAFQIYCDFSGYTDIARGAAKTMGFDLMENFNKPYSATSIADFWRRWHISLSTWFRDYIYIPLGGNKMGFLRQNSHILSVFTISGLWHGAAWTFIFWGFLHGIGLVIENLATKKATVTPSVKSPFWAKNGLLKQFLVFVFVALCWIFFRAENLEKAFFILRNLFVFTPKIEGNSLLQIKHILLGFLGIFSLKIIEYFQGEDSVIFLVNKQKNSVRFLIYLTLILAIIFFGVYENRQFIYFQF